MTSRKRGDTLAGVQSLPLDIQDSCSGLGSREANPIRECAHLGGKDERNCSTPDPTGRGGKP